VIVMGCDVRQSILPKLRSEVAVNGVVIPRASIAREVQNYPAPTPAQAFTAAARALVVRELLLQESRRLGIAAVPMEDGEGRRETEEGALIRALIEREVTTPSADEAICRRYYEQNRSRFRSPDIYEVAHILIAAAQSDKAAYAGARATAAALLAELRAHPGRFAELARAHSACPSGMQGGNLGQLTAGQTTPEFERALHNMPVGSLAGEPVATRYGFHIIRLDRRIAGRELPFELVADRIADYLADSVRRRATAQYIARLISRSEISGIDMPGAAEHRVN
jgi:peptidyl-prolyl cis-trans isomerase C